MAILSNLCVMRSPATAGLILEIFHYITAVKIFANLDLEQNISFLDGHTLMFCEYNLRSDIKPPKASNFRNPMGTETLLLAGKTENGD